MTPRIERLRLYDAVYAESAAMPGFYITLAAIDEVQARGMFEEFLSEHRVKIDPSRVSVLRRESEMRPTYGYV